MISDFEVTIFCSVIEYVFKITVITMDMEENCTLRPCATDFSIAAIMSRHGRARTSRCRDRDPPDPMSPLGKDNVNLSICNAFAVRLSTKIRGREISECEL